MGLDRGVFYPAIGPGESWDGLISIREETTEVESNTRYIDGIRSQKGKPLGYFSGTINAVTHPRSFFDDILTQTRTKVFGMSYRTLTKSGYKLHLVYNIVVAPSAYIHDQTPIEVYSWEFTTLPAQVPQSWHGSARTAHLVVHTSQAYSSSLSDLEDVLYGTEGADPRLPLPEEVFQIFEDNSILTVTDHGDGSFTVDGPDSAIIMLDSTTFEITWPSAVFIDAVSYTIHSL